MNTIQAFDCQMKLIEMNAKGREIDGITVYPTADEIYEEIKLGSAIAEWVQAGVFKFFTQMTPKEYIKHRKLMAAYQKLANDKISMSDACEIAGFASEQALVKKFKQTLDITPGEVRKKGDMSKYTHEVTFERMFGTKPSPEKASWNVGLDEFGRIVLNSSDKVSENTAWIIKAGNNELRLEKQAGGVEDDGQALVIEVDARVGGKVEDVGGVVLEVILAQPLRVDLLQKRGEWKEGSRGLGLKKTKPEA